MAQSQSTGVKRSALRQRGAVRPPAKKAKPSATEQSSPAAQSPAAESPAPEKAVERLPWRLRESRPLPTSKDPQTLAFSTGDFQSIAAAGVLQASLDRSRMRWVANGVFEKYWTKPESGKHARPPPPNNPEVKWQKHKGPCRIRVEPHIFEAEVYVEEKPRPPAPKQYTPPQSAYGQPYRQGYHAQAIAQNRPLPPVQQPPAHSSSSPIPPIQQANPSTPVSAPPPARQQPAPPTQPQEKKADPVISMLANRASSDPQLKALMKEVATGNATQDQLKVFQGHIDELAEIIKERKKKEEAEAAAAQAAKAQAARHESIRYDGVMNTTTPPQRPHQHQQPTYQPQAWVRPPPPPLPKPPPPPPPAPNPVVLSFTTPDATEDRFLFPQHSILESLSPQHLLASFIVTRKGGEAIDKKSLDDDTEYWQPITLMVEVAYHRENIIECVKRWVKPAEETRKHMEEVMKRCTRAPITRLAMRLPLRGSEMAETEEPGMEEMASGHASADEKVKKPRKKSLPAAATAATDNTPTAAMKAETETDTKDDSSANVAPPTQQPAENLQDSSAAPAAPGTPAHPEKEVKLEAADPEEGGRPKRTTRKSVRISEG